MLRLQDLRDSLNPNIDQKRKQRFDVAFRSLGYQEDYCFYHYEQFQKEHKLFQAAYRGTLKDTEVLNPQNYRIAFEANIFAFFRAFHALIESIPYLLNIMLEVKQDSEFPYLNWKTIKDFCAKETAHQKGLELIGELIESKSYKELEHLVNVSKHRRIARIDSGLFNRSFEPKLCRDDLDLEFRSYEIDYLMPTIYNELRPIAISVVKFFVGNNLCGKDS